MTKFPFQPDPLRLVHLTDPHLYTDPAGRLRGVPTLPALQAVLAAARAEIEACQAILVTGDIVQDDPGGYEHFRVELGGLSRPVLCVPGNHDDLPAMRAALSAPPFQLDGTWDIGAWRVVLLNSMVPGETGGRLAAASLAFLEQALASAPDRHALICLHHHPVRVRSRWLDDIGVANGQQFTDLLQRFPRARTVLFGHVHQQLDEMADGVRMIATPSTCSQFKPLSDEFATDDAPPAWRTLTLHADGRVETALKWLHDWQQAPRLVVGAR
ncbi:MAG: 3',5'-cyclic-AMP phosphodiesterase [Steroidobacteraceae bacterium]